MDITAKVYFLVVTFYTLHKQNTV